MTSSVNRKRELVDVSSLTGDWLSFSIDSEQTAALGLLLKYAVEHLVDGTRTISDVAGYLEQLQ